MENSDLVFVHGYGGSQCSWSLIDSEVQKFAQPAYLELVGFGKHEPPDGFNFSIRSQAKALADTIKANNLDDATLVAHSFGAAVLLVAMLDFDVEVRKVVLVDPLAYQQDLPFFIKSQTIPVLSSLASRLLPPSVQVDSVLNYIYFDKKKIPPTVRACYIDEFKTPFHRETLSKTALELSTFNADQYVARYKDISAEFHLIWGREDPLISADFMPKLQQGLRAQSAQLIPDCGHAPHEECPKQFITSLRSALGIP